MDKQYHYVYLITNTLNNKKYIGKHSTNNLDDGYMGSGNLIKQLDHRYLSKEILEFCDSESQAYEREKYWIQYYDAYNNRNFYNLDKGGKGNSSQEMQDRWRNGVYDQPTYRAKQSAIMKERMQNDIQLIENRRKGWEQWWNDLSPEEKYARRPIGEHNPMWGKHHSDESNQKNRLNQPTLLKIWCDEEPNRIFYGLKEASEWAGLTNGTASIGRCLRGKQKTAGRHPVTKQPCHWHKMEDNK